MSKSTRFSLAHLTDLHFAKESDWLNPINDVQDGIFAMHSSYFEETFRGKKDALKRWLCPSTYCSRTALAVYQKMIEFGDSLDAIVVTGDVATTGMRRDIDAAREFFDCLLRPVNAANPDPEVSYPSMLTGRPRVLLMPGNHDRYGALNFPRSKVFEKVFGQNWDFRLGNAFSIAASHFHKDDVARIKYSTFDRDEWVVIFVLIDLSLRNPISTNGSIKKLLGNGRAYPEVVQLASELTGRLVESARVSNKRTFVVWGTHFPPHRTTQEASLELVDFEKIAAAAIEQKVDLVLSGHTHVDSFLNIADGTKVIPLYVSGASSGLSDHGGFSFSVCDIELQGSTKSLQRTTFTKVRNDYRFRAKSVKMSYKY